MVRSASCRLLLPATLICCVVFAPETRAEGTSRRSPADWTTPLVELSERYDPAAWSTPATESVGTFRSSVARYCAAVGSETTGTNGGNWIRRAMARECLCRTRLAATPQDFWYRNYFRPSGWQDWTSLGASAAIVAGSAAMFLSGDRRLISDVSDFGEIMLPALGYGVPAVNADGWGLVQYAVQNHLSMGITRAMKNSVERWRPGLEAPDSFPSAHTTAAFSGASFLHTRYGPNWGVPAYLAATVVGMTRVRLERHYLGDVVAGAGIAMISNWLVAVPFGGECRERIRFGCPRKWRVEFDFGAVLDTANEIEVLDQLGDEVELTRWGDDQGYPTSRFSLQYFVNPRQEVMLWIDPFEIRGGETLRNDLSFAGGSFAAGESVQVRWMAHEYKLRWRYELLPRNRQFDFRVGAAAVLADYQIELLSSASKGIATEAGVTAMPHLYAAWRPVPRLELSVMAEGLPAVYFAAPDYQVVLRWYMRPQWDIGIGYRWALTRVKLDDIENDADSHEIFLAFGRSF